jgi:hypothetical protein
MPSKAAAVPAAFREPPAAAARAQVVATELLDEFLVAVHDAKAALDARLGGETFPAFAHRLEKNRGSSL